MRQGAYSYIAKPAKFDELRKAVKDAIQKVLQKRKTRDLTEYLSRFHEKVKIITRDPAMMRPLDMARQIARVDSNVFITGERGTGKKLFARYIHENSGARTASSFGGAVGLRTVCPSSCSDRRSRIRDPEPRKSVPGGLEQDVLARTSPHTRLAAGPPPPGVKTRN
jgi:hypothetical protein